MALSVLLSGGLDAALTCGLGAAAAGACLAALFGQARHRALRPLLRALHVLLGASAAWLTLRLAAGTAPALAHAAQFGMGGFARLASLALLAALLLGAVIGGLVLVRRRPPVFLLGVHATVALGGILLLAALTAALP